MSHRVAAAGVHVRQDHRLPPERWQSSTSTMGPYPRRSGCPEVLTSHAAEIRATAASGSQPSPVRSLGSTRLPVSNCAGVTGQPSVVVCGRAETTPAPSTVMNITTHDLGRCKPSTGLVMPYVEPACASIPAFKSRGGRRHYTAQGWPPTRRHVGLYYILLFRDEPAGEGAEKGADGAPP